MPTSIFDQIDEAAKQAPPQAKGGDLFAQLDAAESERQGPSLFKRAADYIAAGTENGLKLQPNPSTAWLNPGGTKGDALDSAGQYLSAGMMNQHQLDVYANPQVQETAMRLGLPVAAMAAAPVGVGMGVAYGLGALGGFTGETLAQQSELERGAREKASYGAMVAAPIVAGLPLGPEVNLGTRAFTPAGRLLAIAPQAALKRGAFGGVIGAGASAAEQQIDENNVDWGNVAKSAAFGALFGGVMGGVETYQQTQAAKDAIFQLRKATNNFQGTDQDFIIWAKAKARAHGVPTEAQPAEEGAAVPQEQTPGLPQGYNEPAASPAEFTPDRSVVDRLPHTQEAAGSSPAPAPIQPAPVAPAPVESAPETAIAAAPPPQENAALNPTEQPVPAPATPDLNSAIDQAAAQASNVQTNPPPEPALTPAAVGGPAPAPGQASDEIAGAGSAAAPVAPTRPDFIEPADRQGWGLIATGKSATELFNQQRAIKAQFPAYDFQVTGFGTRTDPFKLSGRLRAAPAPIATPPINPVAVLSKRHLKDFPEWDKPLVKAWREMDPPPKNFSANRAKQELTNYLHASKIGGPDMPTVIRDYSKDFEGEGLANKFSLPELEALKKRLYERVLMLQRVKSGEYAVTDPLGTEDQLYGAMGRVQKAIAYKQANPTPEVAPAKEEPAPAEAKQIADQQEWNDAYDKAMEDYFQGARDSVSTNPPERVSAEAVAKQKGETMTPAAAAARLQKWKDFAKQMGKDGRYRGKIILSLFDSSGEWSKPWREAGFEVIQIDQNIRNKDAFGHEINVMDIDQQWLEDNGLDMVHGVLAACPCTEFAGTGARWFKIKDKNGRTEAAKKLVQHTMSIIEYLQPDGFWSLENPVGRLKDIAKIPLEALQFQPHNYGDPYTKRTQIFGMFNPNLPQANVEPTGGSYAHNLWSKDEKTGGARSKTFEGFAYAFFMANHDRDASAAAEAKADEVVKAKQPKKTKPAKVEAPPKATVEQTPAGPEIAPTATEDRRVSQLVTSKQFKVEKEFLLDAVRKAKAVAPEEGTGVLTIEVPGDGTFKVSNYKAQLQRFSDMIEKRFGKSFPVKKDRPGRKESPYATIYSPFSEPTEGSRKGGKPTSLAPVKAKPSTDDLAKAVALAVDEKASHPDLRHVLADDGFAVGTNSHLLIAVAGGGGETKEAIQKFGPYLARWRQILPAWIKLNNGLVSVGKGAPKSISLDTRTTLKALNQASSMVEDRMTKVGLHFLGKDKLGVSVFTKSTGDYLSDGVTADDKPFVYIDPDLLGKALTAARVAGHERVQFFVDTPEKPVLIIKGGDNFFSVVMPKQFPEGLRPISELRAIEDAELAKQEKTAKPSGIAYQPGYGPGGKNEKEPVAPAPAPAVPGPTPDWATKPIPNQTVTQPPLMETAISKGPLAARIEAKIASLEKLAAYVDEHEAFPPEVVARYEARAAASEAKLARIDKEMEPLEKKDELTAEETKRLHDLEDARSTIYDQDEAAQGDLKAVTKDALGDGLGMIEQQIKLWQKRLTRVNAVRLKAAQSGQLANLPAGATPRSGGRSYASPAFGGNGLPPVAPPAPPPQAPFKPLRPFDNPDFTQLPIQLPEMVQFFRMISGGQNPRIVEKIRLLHGTALGVFRAAEGKPGSGKIELRADLFNLLSPQEKEALRAKAITWANLMKEANPEMDLQEAIRHKYEQLVKEAEAEAVKRDPVRALAVFAHEIGHFIDFLPTGTLRRGNLFGHMATLYHYLKSMIGQAPDIFPVPPTDNERAALRRKAEKELMDSVKEITETITTEEPIFKTSGLTAKMITDVVGQTARDDFPEFYDWFAKLSRADKVGVLKKAMRGIVDERAARFGKREQVGTKTVTKEVKHPSVEITEEQIKARYQELLREELKRRGLISLQDVKRELEGVIAWWRKSPTMPDYFKSASEMYAETFSILMNNPAALAERAPTWWKAFNAYMVRKPAIQKAYNQVQNSIKSGAIFAQRVNNLRESWETAEQNNLMQQVAEEVRVNDLLKSFAGRGPRPLWWQNFKDSLNIVFNKQHGPLQALAAKQLSKPESTKMVAALSDYLYRQTAVESLGRQINMRVEAPLANNDLTHDDLAEYMFHNRIVNGDAVQTANSQGWSPNTSAQRLEEMKKDLGENRFAALQLATRQMRAIYEAGPIAIAERAGIFTPEVMKKIRENIAYSPFNKAPEAFNPMDAGTIEGMLKSAYGPRATAHIFHRVGYLGDIKNPYFALIEKAEVLTKLAYKQIAYKAIRDFLLSYGDGQMIAKAPKVYNGSRLVPKEEDNNKIGTIYTLDNGELNGWYIPRGLYETMEQAQGLEQNLLGVALRFLGPAKAILTELNPGFWPVNFARDLGAFAIQVPGGVGGLKNLPRAYQVAKATFTSKPDPLADQLLARQMAISRSEPGGSHLGHPDELNRWLLRLNKHPELWDPEVKKIGRFMRAWEYYRSRGQVLERTVKAMGMMTVDANYGGPPPDENTPWVSMPEWQKQKIVRQFAGSPDFNERGRGIAFLEVGGGWMFANAWLRGMEAFNNARKNDPAGVWGKFAAFIALPAAAFLLYELGYTDLGQDAKTAENTRDMLRSIPERDKLRGFTIPLGWINKQEKKVAYIVLPFPEQPRMVNGVWRKMLQSIFGQGGKKTGLGSWLAYQSGDLPNQNPIFDAVEKWYTLEVKGQNPWDEFRGRPVLDDDVFKAGQGTGALARDTLSNISGGFWPRPPNFAPGETPNDLEKFLHDPMVGNLAGRWLRVSNGGIMEEDANAIAPSEKQRAELRLLGDQMLAKLDRHEPYTAAEWNMLSLNPYLLTYMQSRLPAQEMGAFGPQVRDFMKANNEGRINLLKMWMNEEAARQQRLNPPPPPPPPPPKKVTFNEGQIYRDPETGQRRRFMAGQFV